MKRTRLPLRRTLLANFFFSLGVITATRFFTKMPPQFGGEKLAMLSDTSTGSGAVKTPAIRVFTIQHNGRPFLRDWFKYHSTLFGADAVSVIDHNSTDEDVTAYTKYIARTGAIVKHFSGSFSKKHDLLSDMMRESDGDILIPLDIDEFIVKFVGDNITTSRDEILSSLNQLSNIGDGRRFRFQLIHAVPSSVCLDGPKRLRPASCVDTFLRLDGHRCSCSSKSFYPKKGFIATDQGNHGGVMAMDARDILANFTVVAPASLSWGPKSCPYFHASDLAIVHYGSFLPWELYMEKNMNGARLYNHTARVDASLPCGGGNGRHYCQFYRDYSIQGEAAVRSRYIASIPAPNLHNHEIKTLLTRE
ncbi:MAG: hypothetical protein J3K34DRAFT_446296 [Monoraphidium minutum]|nr:MAG: hypothetical protein J3K34DRAFT_446296 [Monoraphidium minutum]